MCSVHDLATEHCAVPDVVPDMWSGCCVQARLGCNSELILDEFGAKLLEELDYQQEARNIEVRPLATWGADNAHLDLDAQGISATPLLVNQWRPLSSSYNMQYLRLRRSLSLYIKATDYSLGSQACMALRAGAAPH